MRRFLCGLILTFCGSSLLLGADDQRLRAQLGYVSSPTELLPADGSLGAQSALGGRLSCEYLFTERFGLEMGISYLNLRTDAAAGKLGVETLSRFAGVVWSRK